MTENKSLIRRKIYFLVIATVGVIGTLISGGIIIEQVLNNAMISNNERIHSSRYSYILEDCSRENLNGDLVKARPLENAKPNEKQIAQCKEDKKNEILITRAIDYKESLIGGLSRGILFLILMITHLPAFLKTSKKH